VSVIDGCRVLCGYCEREIGDAPLQEHVDSGECTFFNVTYHPLHLLPTSSIADEAIHDWMAP
jgi:hypothetical protein